MQFQHWATAGLDIGAITERSASVDARISDRAGGRCVRRLRERNARGWIDPEDFFIHLLGSTASCGIGQPGFGFIRPILMAGQ